MIKRKVTSDPYAELKARIKPVHELPLVLSALFFGRSGTGKTTLAATFPKPALLLDIRERGTDSVYDVEGIDVLEVTSWEEIDSIYWMLKQGTHYKTVIIDQVTSLQDLCQQYVLAKEEKTQMSQRLYGEVSGMMKLWLINYRDLTDDGVNVCFIAHDRATTTESEAEDQLEPNIGARLMPSVAGTLNGAVKVIGQTFVRERFGPRDPETKKRERFVDYCLRVGPHSVYTTKLRVPKGKHVPPFLVNATYDMIVKVMRDGITVPTKPAKKEK